MAEIKSGKVKKTPPTLVPANRYEFLNLADAEPDLGVPDISGKVLTSNTSGVRSWESNTTYIVSATTPTSPSVRDVWFNSDDGRTYIYYNDGNTTQWVEFGNANIGGSFGIYTAWTPTGVTWAVGNGTWSAFYARVNNMVHIYGTFTWGSTSSITGSLLIGGLPVSIKASMISSGGYGADCMIGNATFQTTGVGGANPYIGYTASNSATQIRLWVGNTSQTYARSTATTATVPFTWAAGDTFRFSAFYEAA
jgi:hypothetical protein